MSGGERTIGLLGATGVGVGAIVGGGILALAGTAFATTGPSALIAFTLNGVIAVLTALSFAELAASFPESGGTYTFAKKVLSVEAAFGVGWIVYFASIVAAVLYALGFAVFAEAAIANLMVAPPPWITGRFFAIALAVGAITVYTAMLLRTTGGGGQLETIGKVVVFVVLILAGIWALGDTTVAEVGDDLTPFFYAGIGGLIQAMGYTFIALQGFDLIAAVGGEVRDPERNLPRAMLLSLAIALLIYIPLLFLIATVGMPPGGDVQSASVENPETIVPRAVQHYLGRTGFWLVIAAGLLSMLSALQANLLAASRMALAMARDRTLPSRLGYIDRGTGTPRIAILATAATVAVIVIVVPSVAAAGAVSSLIFLLSFTLTHGAAYLVRKRRGDLVDIPFQTPFFPLVPVLGGGACLALAVFQGIAVPSAGVLGGVWLLIGAALYAGLFGQRAQVVDAGAEAFDPELVRLRGRNPLVLVPVANPASAAPLVGVAQALTTPQVGRVLLLSVVRPPESWNAGEPPPQLVDAQSILGHSLATAFAAERTGEALITIANEPWAEIGRVSRTHACEALLLGLGHLAEGEVERNVEAVINAVDSDVVVLRAPPGWSLDTVRRVLVPVGGRRDQSTLRARLLGHLCRTSEREITYLVALSPTTLHDRVVSIRNEVRRLSRDELPGMAGTEVDVVTRDDVAAEIVDRARHSDLIVFGMRRLRSSRRRSFGPLLLRVARETDTPIIMISRR
ncbi:MAG: amino acid permease [Acidobacteriota bacterium]